MRNTPEYQKTLSNNLTRVIEQLSLLPNSKEILAAIMPQIDFNEETVSGKMFADRVEDFKSNTKDNILFQLSEEAAIACISPNLFIQKYDTYPEIPFNYLAISGRKNYFKAYLDAYLQVRQEDAKKEKSRYHYSPTQEASNALSAFTGAFSTLVKNKYQAHYQVKNNTQKSQLEFVEDVFEGFHYFISTIYKNQKSSKKSMYGDIGEEELSKTLGCYEAALYLSLGQYKKYENVLKTQKIQLKEIWALFNNERWNRVHESAKEDFLKALSKAPAQPLFEFLLSQKNSKAEIQKIAKELVEKNIREFLHRAHYTFSGDTHMVYADKGMRDAELQKNYKNYIWEKEKLSYFESHPDLKDFIKPYLEETSAQALKDFFSGVEQDNPRLMLDTLQLYARHNINFSLEEKESNFRTQKSNTSIQEPQELNVSEVLYLYRYALQLHQHKLLELTQRTQNLEYSSPDIIDKKISSLDNTQGKRSSSERYYRCEQSYVLRQAQINHLTPISLVDFSGLDAYYDSKNVNVAKVEKIIHNGQADILFKTAGLQVSSFSSQFKEKLALERDIQQKNMPTINKPKLKI